MGLTGLLVDPDQFARVKQRLADADLCGPQARVTSVVLPPPPPPLEKSAPQKRPAKEEQQTPPKRQRAERFQVEAIIAEEPPSPQVWHRYLVSWAGYRPEWEAWRIPGRGTVGQGPIETWEKATVVRKHYRAALAAWEAQQQPAAAAEEEPTQA